LKEREPSPIDQTERLWFEKQLQGKSEECSSLRSDLQAAGRTLTQLRHNFVYEVRLLQKAISDLQNSRNTKKNDPESSLLKEYSRLLIEREQLSQSHESDVITIKELKESYSILVSEKPKRASPNRPQSRDASRSPTKVKPKKKSASELNDIVQVESILPATRSSVTHFSIQSQVHVEIRQGEPDPVKNMADVATASDGVSPSQFKLETYSSFITDRSNYQTRDVAILARHIDMGHAVSQTDLRGIDVSCSATEDSFPDTHMLSEADDHMLHVILPEDTLHQMHLDGDQPEVTPRIPENEASPLDPSEDNNPPSTEVQYIQSSALNESFSLDPATSNEIE
jgi:hypothetical protein